MERETGEQPHGENEPGIKERSLQLPDVPGDERSEGKSLEKSQKTKRRGFHRMANPDGALRQDG